VELVYVFFAVGSVVTIAFIGFELLEGLWSLTAFDGDDEEWMAPLAVFSLLAFMAGLSYFG
jgi:hypothetical protein